MQPHSNALNRLQPELDVLRCKLLAAARATVRSPADAEDIVQTALLRAFEQAERLPPDINWTAWLRTVVRNLGIDHVRSRLRHVELGACEDLAAVQPNEEPDADWTSITGEQLQRAWNACEPLHRQVFELRFVHGLSYKEIADRLQIPMGTVATRLHRARDRVRARLVADAPSVPAACSACAL